MVWRAFLADGRHVAYDGSNSILPFLDLIVRFEVAGERGRFPVTVPPNHRVIFRWDRAGGPGVETVTLGCKVGLLDRASGRLRMQYLAEGAPTDGPVDVQLLPAEVA